ncbi:alpha/beta hydrolase [Rhodohalobacter halophilus]|uniref:alpha/beta hydrolase n=1 Tax=Rhodohalobacter halophilus TaxID=1812810 RepID=UPI00083F7019|nr:alpha/beta hydrolase [Rhodohalobacter halophilus]
MKTTPFTFIDSTNTEIHAVCWEPENRPPAAVVQIVHGMAEHIGRYVSFANFLTDHGFIVYAHDHRGHGRSAHNHLGYVDTTDAFHTLVDGIHQLHLHITQKHSSLPITLFGHSMGSFLVQRLMQISDIHPAGIIYSGSNGKPPALLKFGIAISTLLAKIRNPKTKSPLINHLTFGEYNKHFKPNRNDFDWLSRDPDKVDQYVEDPLCGFVYSTAFYRDLFLGLNTLHKHRPFADHPKDIPILLVSGDNDPVSEMGKGVHNLEKILNKSGAGRVFLNLYPNGRHEMLHESNRDEVMSDIFSWIQDHVNLS